MDEKIPTILQVLYHANLLTWSFNYKSFEFLKKLPEILNEDEIREKSRVESGLVKSGRLFGGLIADIKRKAPQ